jgi:hypothetical protein
MAEPLTPGPPTRAELLERLKAAYAKAGLAPARLTFWGCPLAALHLAESPWAPGEPERWLRALMADPRTLAEVFVALGRADRLPAAYACGLAYGWDIGDVFPKDPRCPPQVPLPQLDAAEYARGFADGVALLAELLPPASPAGPDK